MLSVQYLFVHVNQKLLWKNIISFIILKWNFWSHMTFTTLKGLNTGRCRLFWCYRRFRYLNVFNVGFGWQVGWIVDGVFSSVTGRQGWGRAETSNVLDITSYGKRSAIRKTICNQFIQPFISRVIQRHRSWIGTPRTSQNTPSKQHRITWWTSISLVEVARTSYTFVGIRAGFDVCGGKLYSPWGRFISNIPFFHRWLTEKRFLKFYFWKTTRKSRRLWSVWSNVAVIYKRVKDSSPSLLNMGYEEIKRGRL